jgi:hypothetical protein
MKQHIARISDYVTWKDLAQLALVVVLLAWAASSISQNEREKLKHKNAVVVAQP